MVEQVDSIKNVLLPEALSERYLSYAISTIVSRSLPDVRDGLKPVHRRLLYAMYQLRLNPESGFKKCARVVGDVIGKYHPHGDSAVYEAMVRLSQEFSVRYPLVDGQGNFGNIDGDNAAAMRYTEAKLTRAAMLLLEGLTENAVDMLETYDGEEQEPVVMPSSYPNILANGATGIAVGMATNIPPHNVSELIDACLLLIKKPNASIKDLCSYVKGPDFPTAGIITTSQEDIVRAYETGRGAFTVRAKWHKETSSNGIYQVIVTEIPFGVTKSKLIERIANLLLDKKLPLLYNIYDESTVDIRIVLEPRSRTVNAEFLMEQLFLHTDLQIRYNMNLNVLDHTHTPKVMNIKEVLNEFLQHRNIVLLRRSQYRLDKILLRIEILEGLLIAYKNLDKVIEIIRFSDDPKQELSATFNLTENQVNAILNMRLRALHKLEENVVLNEHKELCIERDKLLNLISDSELQWKSISNELRQVKKEFNQSTLLGKRKSQFKTAPEIDDNINEIMVEKEAIVIIVSKLGWLRAFKGHHIDLTQIKFKDGDELGFVIDGGYTTDKLLVFTSKGKFYTLSCDKLPPARGQGEPIRLLVNMDSDEDMVQVFKHVPDNKIMLVASNSKGFLVNETKIIAQTKNGKQIMSVSDKIKATHCVVDTKGEYCAVIGNNRKMLVFKKSEIAELTKGQGTLLQRYRDGYISDIIFFNLEDGLKWPYRSSYRHLLDFELWLGSRAQSGHMAPHGFPRNNKFYREK